MDRDDSFAAKVRSALMELLPGGAGTVDDVARKLGISRRTLQRKLTEENTSFHPSGNKPVFEKNDIRSFMILTKDDTGISAKGIAASGDTKGEVFDEFYVAEK